MSIGAIGVGAVIGLANSLRGQLKDGKVNVKEFDWGKATPNLIFGILAGAYAALRGWDLSSEQTYWGAGGVLIGGRSAVDGAINWWKNRTQKQG